MRVKNIFIISTKNSFQNYSMEFGSILIRLNQPLSDEMRQTAQQRSLRVEYSLMITNCETNNRPLIGDDIRDRMCDA